MKKTVSTLSVKKETLRILTQEPNQGPIQSVTSLHRTVACTVCHTC